MPFTFSHPALVLPLTYLPRKWFSLTGLVIGSLTPDFEYFIRMKIQNDYGHTAAGLFLFDLPVGLLLAFVFHNVVRNSLFDNLPSMLRTRLWIFKQFDWNDYFKSNWLIVIACILVGALSHIFWDSFTHDDGYFVKAIPPLAETVELHRKVSIYNILQHVSTLVGGIAIAWGIFRLPRHEPAQGAVDFRYWLVLIIVAVSILALRFLFGFDYRQYGNLVVNCISAGIISLILTPWLVPVRKK